MTRIYIGVGSNLDPEGNVLQALQLLAAQVRVTQLSTFYRTQPLLRPEQGSFINGVVEAETELPPRELKAALHAIEAELGRVRTEDKYAARTIDLDLLLYGDLQADEAGLRLPDPDICSRAFLVAPLAELAPDLVLPGGEETLEKLAEGLDQSGLRALCGYTERLRDEVRGILRLSV